MSRDPAHPVVVLFGNPNTGKTSLFNHLTGMRARVGNYPGITVERRFGTARLEHPTGAARDIRVVDAPGTYSLSARSREEQIALREVLGLDERVDPAAVIVVLDAGQLSRSLYLVTQLLELRVPLVVALNMWDEASEVAPKAAALAELLGVPVVPTNGHDGSGVDALLARTVELVDRREPFVPAFEVRYPEMLRRAADRVADVLPSTWRGSVERDRALALWALTSLGDDDELTGIPDALRERVAEVLAEGEDVDLVVAASRYAAIDELLARLELREPRVRSASTERADRILLHPLGGTLVFVATMLVVFQALFSWSDPAIALIEGAMSWCQAALGAALPAGILRDLLVNGIVGGVGNVLVFLPQILLLFLFIGLLEDSGYMARVAYLMDRVMRTLGLHGRAFVPMLSGFACAVPAILATRTLERQRDRMLTMLVVPLMSCSARLPVYSLIIAALFPVGSVAGLPVQALLLMAMYLFGLLLALLAAWVLGRTVVRGRRVPLILELPPYRLPRLRPTLLMLREKASQFLTEAGTVILAATIVLWALLSFPRYEPPVGSPPERAEVSAARALEQSYGGRLGKALEPAIAPLGFDWKIGTGIIGAFAAREVFVSTMALVYGVGEVDESAAPLRDRLRAERGPGGEPAYSPLVGLSLMVFFALACQCMGTLAVVRRETRSWRWPALLFAYMTTLAYLASLAVYQGGRLLGF
jgi:ferrous iron transport protein B